MPLVVVDAFVVGVTTRQQDVDTIMLVVLVSFIGWERDMENAISGEGKRLFPFEIFLAGLTDAGDGRITSRVVPSPWCFLTCL